MKKNNYYSIHKNKKPRKIIIKKPNLLHLKLAITALKSINNYSIIVSQNFNSTTEKSLAVFNNVKNTTKALLDLYKPAKQRQYLSR